MPVSVIYRLIPVLVQGSREGVVTKEETLVLYR